MRLPTPIIYGRLGIDDFYSDEVQTKACFQPVFTLIATFFPNTNLKTSKPTFIREFREKVNSKH